MPVGHLELGDVAELTARVDRLARWEYPARLIDAAEAAALEPSLRPQPGATAAWFAEEAYVLTEPLIDRLVEPGGQPRCRAAHWRAGPGDRTGRHPSAHR